MHPHEALDPDRLCSRCDPAVFDFDTTAALPEPEQPFGQARAVEALRLGLDLVGPGFNVFVFGEPGSGRHHIVRRLLEAHAATRPPPQDWCHVHNFTESNNPAVLRLPAGQGARLHKAMEDFVAELGEAIGAALEGEEYRSRIRAIEQANTAREERALAEITAAADAQGVMLQNTPDGIAFAPMRDGQAMDPETFAALPDDERKRVAAAMQAMRARLDQMMQGLPKLRRETRALVSTATREAILRATGHLVEELKGAFAHLPTVQRYLDGVLADVVKTGAELHEPAEEDEDENKLSFATSLSLNRYRVNLFVGHEDGARAPVVCVDNPTVANLTGRIDQVAHMGTLVTHFMLIKPGALQRANGGYLMLDAQKVLSQPYAWDGLKRALATSEARIESLAHLSGWLGTLPLEPEPIPLALKVVLFGEREHYELLQSLDPEFDELFKVAADFEEEAPRDAAGVQGFAALLGSLARAAGLRALNRDAVGRMVEHASRMVDDSRKLSIRVRPLQDLLREADHVCAAGGRSCIGREDVNAALAARERRADRQRDAWHEAMRRDTLLIATSGLHVGQINGLAVQESGSFRFGLPVRITATARVGEGDLVDIERESTLGQPIHSKGVMILAAFLGARYAQGVPLSLSASLVFEQSYGPVEGDSASLAELCALLSALASVPIRQSLAVTGSVNQHGQVQAVGAVNEKIEGFFDACRERGLEGGQGVVIPATNVEHLMLRDDVVQAAAQGRFRIHAVSDVDEAVELLTGLAAGEPDSKGRLPEGSFNRLVAARLVQMSELRRIHGGDRWRDDGRMLRRALGGAGLRLRRSR
ncbi:MAG TPA: AAA family ATPase [Ideonella sp.]|uniref:Lon protease family protein n=1 Tax=Ideonella sp. TaxID=1929293 RepID=UPI002E311FE2|nr:AAA family ATPase [Ideonella sp.]HEX5685042.1 AAA family ATPase [Ideonella sp.]